MAPSRPGRRDVARGLEHLERRELLAVSILNGNGQGYVGNGGGGPPDVTGAAGPSSYIESNNTTFTIFNKAPGTQVAAKSAGQFFFGTGAGDGGLTQITPTSQRIADVTMVFDDLMGGTGRFILGDLDADLTNNQSQYVFAVSTTSNPTTLTKYDPVTNTGDWRFYQITTTEGSGGASKQSWSDYPGNPGYNADAFVETFNMFGKGPTGTQVVSVTAGDLAAGNPLVLSGAGQNVFRNDVPGGAQNYRPTTMHDSVAGDPMWLIHNPDNGTNLDVVKMGGVLSSAPTYTTTSLALGANSFISSGSIANPLNPDNTAAIDGDDDSGDFAENPGGGGAFDPGSRILKAGEWNNTIVAAHTVAIASGQPSSLASAQPNDKNGNPLGGTGYTVGDILTVNGGTFTTKAQLKVQSVDGTGKITSVTVSTPGGYSSLSGINGGVTGGTGSGAVFSLFFTGELAAQWYAIDVSSGTPTFQKVGGVDNVGRVAFGANTYAFEPAIDINSQGQIGFGFMESDTIGGAITPATGGFISTFVTARQPTDPAGTMQASVLVSAGTGSAPITSRIGDFSGMNVDPSNNTFWHVNEFGGGGPTVIANFTPDAAPLLTPPGAQAAVEGASKTFNLGSFADPDGGPWTVDVNWGDGSPDTIFNVTAPGTIPPKAHTYVEEGFYAGTITVTDTSNGQFDSKLFSIVTADADLTTGVPVALVANTGVALPAATVVGRFTDANLSAPDPDGDFLTTIDWGDGSPLTTGIVVRTGPGAFEIEGGHTYAKPGNYATKISVHDDGGETVLVTGTAAITDLPVTGSTLSFKTIEGQPTGTFALATFEDPNTLATVADVKAELAVNGWGDGTPVAPGVLLTIQQVGVDPANGQPIFQVLGTHTYAEETPAGVPDRLSVVITTLGGATTTLTSPIGGGVTVLDAKLMSSNGTSINGIEGNSTGSVLLGTFIDANQGATVADFTTSPGSVVINWGDGSAPQTLPVADLVAMGSPDGVIFSVNAAHTYPEAGTYAYSVTVADDGGSNTVFSGTAFIADADLKATPTQPPVFTTEAAIFPIPVFTPPDFVGTVGTFTDANPLGTIADFKAMIDWGDGTPLTAGTLTVSQGNSVFTVSGSHTYADAGLNGGNGTYTIQVFVEDDDGKRLTITNTATVADRPIVLTGTINPLTVSGLATGAVNVTNVNQPEFFGKSEPFSTVTLDARLLPGGPLVQIGQAHAGGDGSWDIKSQIALADGHYAITATAIDQFGETTSTAPKVIVSDLLIDTVGPVIDGMYFNHLNGQVDYIIKDPVNPDGSAPSGVWLNTILDSSNYLLTKVHANKTFPGNYKVTNVTATPDPTIPFAYDVAVTINGGRAIRGGFYLFTIRDSSNGNSSVQDHAQNHLDGVFYGSFSSGNSRNGSDFVAELDAYHDKVFAPQTLVGTANPANGGIGGLPVGGVYSGIHVPVIPKGGRPLFSTPTSPSSPVNSSGLFQRVNHRPGFASWTAHRQFRFATKLARGSHASVVTGNHPKGPHHK